MKIIGYAFWNPENSIKAYKDDDIQL